MRYQIVFVITVITTEVFFLYSVIDPEFLSLRKQKAKLVRKIGKVEELREEMKCLTREGR